MPSAKKQKLTNEKIYSWIAKASSPKDRLNSKAFKPLKEQDNVIIQDRIQKWLYVLENNKFGANKILKNRKTDLNSLKKSVLDVKVIDFKELPEWAKNFYTLMKRWLDLKQQKPLTNKNIPFTYIWQELVKTDINNFAKEISDKNIVVHKKAINGLTEYFGQRLYTPIFSVINSYYLNNNYQSQDYQKAINDNIYIKLDFWINSFNKQPILTAIIGEIYSNWLISSKEMLNRFAKDKSIINKYFFIKKGESKIILQDIKCGLGDPHRGGRSVAMIKSNLGEVVYKPKNLLGTQEIVTLLNKLRKISPTFTPVAPKFINKGNYGWEEKIIYSPAQNELQVKNFYKRLGAWLRLLNILNANDFWYDNLIARKDMPYFIDYETIIGYLNEYSENNLATIGILPFKTKTQLADKDAIDISCVVKPGVQQTPLDTKKGKIKITAKEFAVFLENKFIDINNYFQHFQKGFVKMNDILTSKEGETAIQDFLKNIKKARFRHIFIDTWSSYQIIEDVNRMYKTDGIRRAIAHDSIFLYLPYISNLKIIESAINSIKNNDVPIYEIQADNSNAYTAENEIIKNYFINSPTQNIKKNMSSLNNVANDLSEVRALYSLRSDEPIRPSKNGNSIKHYQPIKIAEKIASYLIKELEFDSIEKIKHIKLDEYFLLDRAFLNLTTGFDGACALAIFFSKLYSIKANKKYYLIMQKIYEFIINSNDNNYYYGLLNSNIANIVALNELNKWFTVKPHIKKIYSNIIKILATNNELYIDYRTGISGLIAVMSLSKANNTLEDSQYKKIIQIITSKKLINKNYNPALKKILNQSMPSKNLGLRVTKHYCKEDNINKLLTKFIEVKDNNKTLNNANINAQILLKIHTKAFFIKKIKKLLSSNSKYTDKNLINSLYSAIYLHKYYGNNKQMIEDISLKLINRYYENNSWLADNWADDKHLLSMRHGLTDIGLAFLAQIDNSEINLARLIEIKELKKL